MENREVNYNKSAENIEALKQGETGRGIFKKKQKVDYTKFRHKGVYNRKILRSMLKHAMGTNKIRKAWHQLRAEGRI